MVVRYCLKEAGFANITGCMIIGGDSAGKERKTVSVKFGDCRDYDAGNLFDRNESCVVFYLASYEDIRQADMKAMITVPHGSSYYVGICMKRPPRSLKSWDSQL